MSNPRKIVVWLLNSYSVGFFLNLCSIRVLRCPIRVLPSRKRVLDVTQHLVRVLPSLLRVLPKLLRVLPRLVRVSPEACILAEFSFPLVIHVWYAYWEGPYAYHVRSYAYGQQVLQKMTFSSVFLLGLDFSSDV